MGEQLRTPPVERLVPRMPGTRREKAARWWRLWLTLQWASLRAMLQYRANTAVMLLVGVAYQGSGLASLWVVLHTFDNLAGWALPEVAFLYGLRLCAHGLWMVVLGGLTRFDDIVRLGQFDRILLRPWNPFMLVVTGPRGLEAFGDFFAGLTVFVVAAVVAGPDFSLAALAFCVLAVVGGALIEASLQLVAATLAFRFIDVWAVRWLADEIVTTLATYPHAIYSKAGQRALTFALPVAFIAFLPASVLLDREDGLAVSPWLAYCSPLVGVGLFVLAYQWWRREVRHYASAGGA